MIALKMKLNHSFTKADHFYMWAVLIAAITALHIIRYDVRPLLDGDLHRGQLIGRDFIHFWSAAKLLADGQFSAVYDGLNFSRAASEYFEKDVLIHEFGYPPHFVVLHYPFGLLPYYVSFALWALLSLLLFVVAVAAPDFKKGPVFLALVAPTTILTINTGQTGLITAALFVGAMRLLWAKPIWAGILLGILTIKPNLGLLIPIALLAGGLWRPFLAAAATVVFLIVGSALVVGWDVWLNAYPDNTHGRIADFFNHGSGIFRYMMLTVLMSLKLIGVDSRIAYSVQAVVALLAVGLVIVAFRGYKNGLVKSTLLATLIFVSSPYAHNYDMAMLSGMLILLISEYQERDSSLPLFLTLAVVWFLPDLGFKLSVLGYPVAPLVLIAFAIILFRQLEPAHADLPLRAKQCDPD